MSKQPRPPGSQAPVWEETAEEGSKACPAPWLETRRDQIRGRYWELANLDPKVTKGNISGQLKALDSLREELALAPAENNKIPMKLPMKRMRSPEVYRSGWMGNP